MGKLKQVSLVCAGLAGGILISLQFSAMAEKEVRASLPIEELRTFAEVFNAIKQGYVEPIEDKKLITHAISGMLSNLDPHSSYLDADSFKDLQTSTQGEFGGLGIEVGMEDGLVKVISPIEDTPAYRAGVKSGDLIFKLDDKLVKGMTLTDAVKRMRGKPKTQIKLSILRKGEAKPIEITLTREVIKVQSVKSKLVEDGYGYLRITSFQENTAASVVKHLNDLYKAGSLKGLVLDLRNNPGGLLTAARDVSDYILPAGPIVTVKDRSGHTESYDSQGLEKQIPLVVLINKGSASASEIVAGAVQDEKAGTIIGTNSYGKGTVQVVLNNLGDQGIKVTIAKYHTPNDRVIDGIGIKPDITIELPKGASSEADDTQLQKAIEVLMTRLQSGK